MGFVARRMFAAVGLFAAALALPVSAAEARPIDVRTSPVPLNPEDPAQERIGRLRYLGGLQLNADHAYFGGLSGLVVSPDGGRLLAIVDRAHRLTARILRGKDGRLLGLADADIAPLIDLDGKVLRVADHRHDSEAVEREADGSLLVSFERRHRIYRYPAHGDPAVAKPARLPLPEGVTNVPFNGGFEAIAPLAGGRLLIVSEDAIDEVGDRVGWLLRDGRAAALGYVPTGLFKPTDFAVLPDGDLLALERRYTLVGGAAARIQRIPGKAIRPGARLQGEEIARLERPLTLDNYEGLAVAQADDGGILVFIVSDDNFNPVLQRTLLLLFRLEG